jgi:hypothetical protein
MASEKAKSSLVDWLFEQITEPLEPSQWNKRMSLLTHRYLREYGIDREEEIVDKAFRTLALFCVGDEAMQSLEVSTACSNFSSCVDVTAYSTVLRVPGVL